MKRWLPLLAVVLALVAGGLWWAYSSLDFIVKATIERIGPQITGSAVTVHEVRISAADGRGTLRGVAIGNPPGFAPGPAIRVGEITVGVDPATLRSEIVVIREILVEAPQVAYEPARGGSNLEALQRNIEAYVKRSAGEGEGEGGAAGAKATGRRYVIGRILLRGAKVTMTNPLLKGGGLTFGIPDVDLRDLGKGTGGVTAAEAARRVTASLTAKIAQRVLTNLDLLRQGGAEGVKDALRGLFR